MNSNRNRSQLYHIDIGNGFSIESPYESHLAQHERYLSKHGVLGKGVLHFVNRLSDVVNDKKEILDEKEYDSLKTSLRRLIVTYDSGELYYYLLHAHGAEAINYNAWVRFSIDSRWEICKRTFTDMPTEVLEQYGKKSWKERSGILDQKTTNQIMEAIGKRGDIYGIQNLPSEMVYGLLFES